MISFYERPEWKELRYQALNKYGRRCMSCGDSEERAVKEQRVAPVLQVDHIKPRSIYPELALVLANLQVLCRPCNQGKSNKHADDLRPIGPVAVLHPIRREIRVMGHGGGAIVRVTGEMTEGRIDLFRHLFPGLVVMGDVI